MQNLIKPIFLKDYAAPDYLIKKVDLTFHLDETKTKVSSTLYVEKVNINDLKQDMHLVLNGAAHHVLISLFIDGIEQNIDQIKKNEHDLILSNLPAKCVIKIENTLSPSSNKSFDGLYQSNGIYCTDCEPQGFRKITYFQDRPDNMAIYTVKIIASKLCSVLLSNGNLIEEGHFGDDQHYAIWHDPFPKPSYLFAVVAGNLSYIEDQHIRPNGKPVRLRVYAKAAVINQCHFALKSLKKSFEWDEQRFGLVCDLDIYNVVAVDDFNGGAMENKGLNLFNTKFVLADSQTATDIDFDGVESVIAHEYFHNWTGNRVTCRDWFQLSLKEGLTVFRDQEFSSDMNHRGLQRINDVQMLKLHQFAEDSSALSHPVRPDHYLEMRNFYTTTVYEKGAEVVRLYQTLLGTDGFKLGMALYFERFDGMAVTCDDFLKCMRDANKGKQYSELLNFERWYSQAGTPEVQANSLYNAQAKTYSLHFTQILKDSPLQLASAKKPQLIPIKLSLFNEFGGLILTDLVVLIDTEITITYDNIESEPTPSLLQEFSAPINFKYTYKQSDLLLLSQFDIDDFNRFDAANRLMTLVLLSKVSICEKVEALIPLYLQIIHDAPFAPAFFAKMLMLPELNTLMTSAMQSDEYINEYIDVTLMHKMRNSVMKGLADKFSDQFVSLFYSHCGDNPKDRALKNVVLEYLSMLSLYSHLSADQYYQALNMTDRFAALKCILMQQQSDKNDFLNDFLLRFSDYPLVIDKWFSLQASDPNVTCSKLIELSEHALFNYSNPNRMRALIGAVGQNVVFLHQNPMQHFTWLGAELLKVDAINPQIAARLAAPFSRLLSFELTARAAIQMIIRGILDSGKCSKNLFEQLSKSVQV